MGNQLNHKWSDIEKRRHWYEMYGENAAILDRAKRDYKPRPLPALKSHSFYWLFNKVFKAEVKE